jgi:hypothetical protein
MTEALFWLIAPPLCILLWAAAALLCIMLIDSIHDVIKRRNRNVY